MPPLFTCLKYTDPRGRVCRPRALRPHDESWRSKLGPDAPMRTPVVCPAGREPGSRQPDQYAPDRRARQIAGHPSSGWAATA